MKILTTPTPKQTIIENYNKFFKTMIKAVVDIRKGIMAINGELHADLEYLLLDNSSQQEDLWGINLFLSKEKKDWIEYTALINIRPSMDNRSMEVEDPQIREKIKDIVYRLITE
ncbi:MAG TPA: hypothetical protein ENI34_02090 [candidate division WOR-3 bacterium]|uniref:Uncharacterized protein n=1 Tax=candidate division WOR-3 bacterium TaxID=2052148 RepID=A0A9C9ELS9_UNCW3|nr:hypothetical protein [candidate division WOR-3 bacterium]